MNFGSGRGRREEPFINVISLVDVMVILVIFLSVSTTFSKTGGLNVNLPKTATQDDAKPKKELVVAIAKDGRLYADGKATAISDLDKLLTDRAAKGMTDAPVVIQADEMVPHGKVVEIMDLAKGRGFHKLAIATEYKGRK